MSSAYEGNRNNATWTFSRVSFPGYSTLGTYDCFTGGAVKLSSNTSIKATCELDWAGEPPNANDLLQVSYSFVGDDGLRNTVDVGTFIVSYDGDSATEDGETLLASGTVTGRSVLAVLDDVKTGAPYTIHSGSDLIFEAGNICRLHHLAAQPTGDSYIAKNSHTFDPGASMLEIVNWCLDAAGYQSADVDPYGWVVFRKREEPTIRDADWEFKAGSESILGLAIKRTNDYLESPNTIRLCYQDEDCCLSAYAQALSGCRSALKERGNRETSRYEELTELEGDATTAAGRTAMGNALADKARQMLLAACREIDKCEWTHPLVPIRPGSCARISAPGYDAKFAVTNMQINITPSALCTTSGRRFIDSNVEAVWSYEWMWY